MGQVTIGWQLGGQAYSQIILFKNADVYTDFIKGQFEFGADATAVALTYGASAGASTKGASASAGDTKAVGSWKRGHGCFHPRQGRLDVRSFNRRAEIQFQANSMSKTCPQTGAVSLIQRFGSAL